MSEFTAKYQGPDEKDQDEDDDLDEGSNAISHREHASSHMLLTVTLVLMIALAASLVGSKSYDNKANHRPEGSWALGTRMECDHGDNKDKFFDRGLKPIRCHTHAACTNTDGSYTCSCISGFGGDGQVCRDIDESRDGSHDRSWRATCTKTVGFYSCSCNDGFHGYDRFCFDNDGCGDGSRLCVNKPGSNITWSYRKDYTGNGRYCEGQEESVLSLPDNVLKSVETMVKEDVVEEFKRSLRIGEASLKQPDDDTKRWVRCLFQTAASKRRDDLMQHLRQITPAGTTGPRLPETLHVRYIPRHIMRDLTINLSGGDEWKLLAERFALTQAEIRYLDKRTMNPCNVTLHFIANRYRVTVGDLYSLLVDCELPTMADLP